MPESSSDSVSRFKLKRTLETLASKEGRGTELISLYVPPDRKIHEVMGNLRDEYGTATNIKSRTTRKNVQEAIERTLQRLKLFKQPPKNGLVIFCGAIPRNGPGTERMETNVLEPPEPINVYLYRCDARFVLEPLLAMVRERDAYGVLVIDSSDFVEGDYLNYMLKEKILATVDTSYTGQQGVEEIINKSQDVLRGVRYLEEKRIVQKFLYEIGHETGLGVYGETQVRKYLNAGVVDLLIVYEKMNMLHVYTKCKNCGTVEDHLIPQANFVKFEQDLLSTACKKCNATALYVEESKDLVDELLDFAEKQNANVAVISTETDEGVMLKDSFGGIAAILRYKVS